MKATLDLEQRRKFMSKLQQILEDAGFETRSYSGRAMYGKSCLGVEVARGQSLGELFATIIENVEEDDRYEVAQQVRRLCTDSMGLGTIVYFPNVEFDDANSEDQHDCPECGETMSTAEIRAWRAENGGEGAPALCEECAEDEVKP